MHRAACLLLACCGSTATPGPSSSPAAKGIIANTGPQPLVLSFRVLRVRGTESLELETEQLTIDGTRMSLVLGGRTTSKPADGRVCATGSVTEQCTSATTIDGWQDVASITMTGTAERRNTGFVLDYTLPVTLCTEQWVDAAPASATVNVRDCGWSLATERIKVLGCKVEGRTKPYAPPPGLEQVDPAHEPNDCKKRPMYRRVRADGSVAPALRR